jgi:hypothetical protein
MPIEKLLLVGEFHIAQSNHINYLNGLSDCPLKTAWDNLRNKTGSAEDMKVETDKLSPDDQYHVLFNKLKEAALRLPKELK